MRSCPIMILCVRRQPRSRLHQHIRPRILTLWLGIIVGLLALQPASAADFTPDQRKAIESIIREYLTKNPEVMLDALEAAKEKLSKEAHDKAGANLAARRQELFEDPASPVAGNPKGDVTVVEFFDYRCPYCKQVEPALEALLKEDRQLRLVYKELPILGKDSIYATRAALAARKQGKYDKFHAAMMAAKGQIDEKIVLQVAAASGVDVERLKSDMNAGEIDEIIKRNYDLAQALDIHGTPAFVIGGEL